MKSARMTAIEVITVSGRIFVGKITVETTQRDFPDGDNLDGLRVYRVVTH
jgi:hypothetical protein